MAQYQKPEATAVDGKSITSTVRNATKRDPSFVSLVSFFGQNRQLIYQIGWLENDQGSEIQVVPELLSQLQISKAIFTWDALPCQKNRRGELSTPKMVR